MNEIAQINHWLTEFTKLANQFWMEENYKMQEYWKGQVMGIVKVVHLMKIQGIDTKYFLTKMY